MRVAGLKKDPGIPNLYPFKEQLLKQMEERKEKAEEEKAERKLQRRKEKKRSLQVLAHLISSCVFTVLSPGPL